MISGPTIPNTVHGVRELLTRHAGMVEHGLEVLCEDLVFGEGVQVDVLARDASGAPVCVFLVVPELVGGLPGRVLGARAWLQNHAGWLAQGIDDPGLDLGRAPRFLVLGLDVPATLVDELRVLPCSGLMVQQFCAYSIAGVRHLGVTDLLRGSVGGMNAGVQSSGVDSPGLASPGVAPEPVASHPGLSRAAAELGLPGSEARELPAVGLVGAGRVPASEPQGLAGRGTAQLAAGRASGLAVEDCFSVPEGVQDPAERAVAARFLDLCSRIDPDLRVRGDRFHRRLSLQGELIAELLVRPEGLRLRLASQAESESQLLLGENCLDLVDAMLRQVLAVAASQVASSDAQGQPAVGQARRQTTGSTGRKQGVDLLPATAPSHKPAATRSESRPAPDPRHFSLEPIRRSVAAAQLSHEEFSALGEAGPDEQQRS